MLRRLTCLVRHPENLSNIDTRERGLRDKGALDHWNLVADGGGATVQAARDPILMYGLCGGQSIEPHISTFCAPKINSSHQPVTAPSDF